MTQARSLLLLALLCASPALAQVAPNIGVPGGFNGGNTPQREVPYGDLFVQESLGSEINTRNGSGTVLRRISNNDPKHKIPISRVIRDRDGFVEFTKDERTVDGLLRGQIQPGIRKGDRAVRLPAQLELGRDRAMLVGIHLGMEGSEGYTVEITRVARDISREPAQVRIYYKITEPNGSQGGRINFAAGGSRLNRGVTQQTFASAHVVKIPYLPSNDEFEFIDQDAENRFRGLDQVALQVSNRGVLDVSLAVDRWGMASAGTNKARLYVDEQFRLYKAMQASSPAMLVNNIGNNVIPHPPTGRFRRSGEFTLGVTPRRGRLLTARGSYEGSLGGRPIAELLEPLREALSIIEFRLKNSKYSYADIQRMVGRLGGMQLLSIVTGTGNDLQAVEIGSLGQVVTNNGRSVLNENEFDHLASLLSEVDPASLPDQPFDLPPQQKAIGRNDWRGEFRMEYFKDGRTKDAGGFVDAAFGQSPVFVALYETLTAIYSRVAKKRIQVTGTVTQTGQGLVLQGTRMHYYLNESESLRTGIVEKLKEWSGEQVTIAAHARITGHQMAETLPTGRILYPSLGVMEGVLKGMNLTIKPVGQKQTGGTVKLFGPRAQPLLGGLNGQWVRIKGYVFYGADLQAQKASVEMLQVTFSRRSVYKMFTFRNRDDENFSTAIWDHWQGGNGIGTIFLTNDEFMAAWATNRRNGRVYFPAGQLPRTVTNPDGLGWVDGKDKIMHLSENPSDVDGSNFTNGGGTSGFLRALADAGLKSLQTINGTTPSEGSGNREGGGNPDEVRTQGGGR